MVLCQSILYSKMTQLYTYILFLLYSFPLWFIAGCWIEFPVPYRRTLLFIHSTYTSLHLLIPNSQSIHPSHPLGNLKSDLCVCESVLSVSLSLFCRRVHLCHILDSIYKWYIVFVSLWLTSLSTIISSCIHVATNGNISFFLWLNSVLTSLFICQWALRWFPRFGNLE